jgi:hypothetical protein
VSDDRITYELEIICKEAVLANWLTIAEFAGRTEENREIAQ